MTVKQPAFAAAITSIEVMVAMAGTGHSHPSRTPPAFVMEERFSPPRHYYKGSHLPERYTQHPRKAETQTDVR